MNEKELLSALGPLASLYQDPEVIEITVDAYDRISVERKGKLDDTDVKFPSPGAFYDMIVDVLALDDIILDPDKTLLDVRLLGRDRMIVATPPTAVFGPYVVIRKFSTDIITWERLLEYGSVSEEMFSFFRRTFQQDVGVLVAGGRSSGKTTFANRLAELIPEDNRIVVVEHSHAMNVRHPRAIYLEASSIDGMTVNDLLDTARNMLAHWLVVSELHGAESLVAMQLFGSGHSGMGIMHALDPQDALARLEAMCLMAVSGLGLIEIRNIIGTALNMVGVVNRVKLPDGRLRRCVTHIDELQGLENNRYILQPLFRFNLEKGDFESTGVKPSWEE
jgi:pilus assembly protein CpaF